MDGLSGNSVHFFQMTEHTAHSTHNVFYKIETNKRYAMSALVFADGCECVRSRDGSVGMRKKTQSL